MIKKYDVMMRTLYDGEPADWLDYLRFVVPDPCQLRILDSNISTIGAEVDKAVWVCGPEPFIVHTEFVSGPPTHPALSTSAPMVETFESRIQLQQGSAPRSAR